MLAFKLRESIRVATVTTRAGHRGEHEGNRKTIAQGMPVETGEPVEDYRILCGHGCIGHPAFPAPSALGARLIAKLGQTLSREREGVPSIVIPGRAKREL